MLGNNNNNLNNNLNHQSNVGEFARWFEMDKKVRECEYQVQLGLQMLRSKYTFTQLKGLSHLLRYIVRLASSSSSSDGTEEDSKEDEMIQLFVNSQDSPSGPTLFIAPVLLEIVRQKYSNAAISNAKETSISNTVDEEFGILALELLQALCVHSVMSRMLFVNQDYMNLLLHITTIDNSSIKIIVRCLECLQCILSQMDYNIHNSFESCHGLSALHSILNNHTSNQRITQAGLECLYIYLSPVIETTSKDEAELHKLQLIRRKHQLETTGIQPDVIEMLWTAKDLSEVKSLKQTTSS